MATLANCNKAENLRRSRVLPSISKRTNWAEIKRKKDRQTTELVNTI